MFLLLSACLIPAIRMELFGPHITSSSVSLPGDAIVSDGNRGMSGAASIDLSKVDDAGLNNLAAKIEQEVANRALPGKDVITRSGNRRTPTLDGSNSGWGK